MMSVSPLFLNFTAFSYIFTHYSRRFSCITRFGEKDNLPTLTDKEAELRGNWNSNWSLAFHTQLIDLLIQINSFVTLINHTVLIV